MATDGNFHHRHHTLAGDSPEFYEPAYILPKAQVDAVGRRLEEARARKPRSYEPKVPDEAVDECEDAHEATNGSKDRKKWDQFDDMGLMTLVCQHDIPLFFANIDTPGEQQKYSVALLEHLFSLLPPQATVVCLYDVGCVLDRSAQQVSPFSLCVVTDLTEKHSTIYFLLELPDGSCSRPPLCMRTAISGLVN